MVGSDILMMNCCALAGPVANRPVAKALGIDTVHFGIVFTVNLAIGLFHPPFGINIFVAQSVLGIRLETIYRGILPFVLLYLIALVLITYVPDISLVGVRLLFN